MEDVVSQMEPSWTIGHLLPPGMPELSRFVVVAWQGELPQSLGLLQLVSWMLEMSGMEDVASQMEPSWTIGHLLPPGMPELSRFVVVAWQGELPQSLGLLQLVSWMLGMSGMEDVASQMELSWTIGHLLLPWMPEGSHFVVVGWQ